MPTAAKDSPQERLESRVGRLEGAMETLTHDVQQVTKSVQHLAENMGSFEKKVLEHIGKATAPKWPLITAFAMLIIMIITLGASIIPIVMSGQRDLINSNTISIERLQESQRTELFESGYDKAYREHILKRLNDEP